MKEHIVQLEKAGAHVQLTDTTMRVARPETIELLCDILFPKRLEQIIKKLNSDLRQAFSNSEFKLGELNSTYKAKLRSALFDELSSWSALVLDQIPDLKEHYGPVKVRERIKHWIKAIRTMRDLTLLDQPADLVIAEKLIESSQESTDEFIEFSCNLDKTLIKLSKIDTEIELSQKSKGGNPGRDRVAVHIARDLALLFHQFDVRLTATFPAHKSPRLSFCSALRELLKDCGCGDLEWTECDKNSEVKVEGIAREAIKSLQDEGILPKRYSIKKGNS
ncbi:MAG: hypothetical protein K2X27_21135 [Candidatus Obscuribacterales bacterium]|nr:hypothetical protein [Candidatus Obscuribacterales bacterium]